MTHGNSDKEKQASTEEDVNEQKGSEEHNKELLPALSVHYIDVDKWILFFSKKNIPL